MYSRFYRKMLNLETILNNFNFSKIPLELLKENVTKETAKAWFDNFDWNEAIDFYGLRKHQKFMSMFDDYLKHFRENNNLAIAVYVIHHYLFADKKYGWDHTIERNNADMFPALVLLSGWQTHLANMKQHNFDNTQIEKHKARIYECCTIGFDTYGLDGIECSQLIWGSIFINAHIVEIGRLQYEVKKFEYSIPNLQIHPKFCIGIHIFRGEKLHKAAVDASLKEARLTIPTYFKELGTQPKFFIHSWLLAQNLDNYLNPDSNISYFRKLFEILNYTNTTSIVKFLYNTTSDDISAYAEDTSLRRQVKQAMQQGIKFYDGIGLLKENE